MKWYFRAIVVMQTFAFLSTSLVQLRLFKDMSPTTMVTCQTAISFFNMAVLNVLRKPAAIKWLVNNRYVIVRTELTLCLIISFGVLWFGISSTTLIVRWVLAMTLMEAMNVSVRYLFESVKQERGDGAYVSATKDSYTTMGYALGGVLAVLVMNVYPGINQDALIYAHGFLMSLGSIGMYACLKEHDRANRKS